MSILALPGEDKEGHHVQATLGSVETDGLGCKGDSHLQPPRSPGK